MNDAQEKCTLNVDMSNVHRTVQKYTENDENSKCIEKPQTFEYFGDGKISNISSVSDNFKDVQMQKAAQPPNAEGGGGLSSNREDCILLETVEKDFEGLNMKNESTADEVQTIADVSKSSNDQTTSIKAEINNVQNEMESMHDRKTTKELENAANFKAIVDKMVEIHSHIDQFTVVVNGLKFAVEDACENKETITDIMKASEYLRAHYALQLTENQRNFTEQINKHRSEIDQLKAYADISVKEVDTLKERASEQQLCIDSYEKSMKCITDKLSNFFSYIKQLQNENDQLAVPDKNQKELFFLLAEQLEKMEEMNEYYNKGQKSKII